MNHDRNQDEQNSNGRRRQSIDKHHWCKMIHRKIPGMECQEICGRCSQLTKSISKWRSNQHCHQTENTRLQRIERYNLAAAVSPAPHHGDLALFCVDDLSSHHIDKCKHQTKQRKLQYPERDIYRFLVLLVLLEQIQERIGKALILLMKLLDIILHICYILLIDLRIIKQHIGRIVDLFRCKLLHDGIKGFLTYKHLLFHRIRCCIPEGVCAVRLLEDTTDLQLQRFPVCICPKWEFQCLTDCKAAGIHHTLGQHTAIQIPSIRIVVLADKHLCMCQHIRHIRYLQIFSFSTICALCGLFIQRQNSLRIHRLYGSKIFLPCLLIPFHTVEHSRSCLTLLRHISTCSSDHRRICLCFLTCIMKAVQQHLVERACLEHWLTGNRRHKKDKSQKQAGRQPFFVFNFL